MWLKVLHRLQSFSLLKTISLSILVFIFYVAAGKLGLSLASVNPSSTVIWAPTGIALAAVLIFGFEMLPAIFLGAFVVNVTTTGGIVSSLGVATGNMLEAYVGAYLIQKYAKGAQALDSISNIFKFLFLASVVSTMVSATIGVAVLILTQNASLSSFWNVWITWWLGDMGGSIVFAPFLLVWAAHPHVSFSIRGFLHIFAAFVAIIFVTEVIFLGILPYAYLCIPLGVWIAFWFGRRGATTSTLIVATLAIVDTLHKTGPFAIEPNVNQSLIFLQLFLNVFSLTGLIFGIVLLEFRRSEKIIASHEKRFQTLLEKSFDAFVLIDPSSRIMYASPSVKRLLGYTPEELVGTEGFNLVHKEDKPKIMRELASLVLKPGSTVTVEYKTIRKDKKILWVEANGTNLLLDPLVNAIVVNFRDITERKNHEEESKQSEQRFKSLVEKSGQGIALVDKNGKVMYTTATITDILGYSQEEYEKLDPASLMHPDDMVRVQKQSKDILNKPGANVAIQYRVKHKNGTYRWFDVLATNLLNDQAVHAYVVNFRDITDIKNLEETERKEKVQDEAMLGSIGDGVFATDNTGKTTLINKRGTELLGWSEQDFIGKNITDVIPLEDELGQDLTGEERPIMKVLRLGKPIITSSTIFYIRKDKTKFPVHFTVTPIIIDKKVIGAIEVFHDITQEKEVDRAKTEFVSIASHQLRTPLATINWYLEELMAAKSNYTDKQLNYLKEVYSASKRMVDLINALLNTSRLEMGTFIVEPGVANIQDVAKQVVKDLTLKIEQKHIKIKEEYQEDLPTMKADSKLLAIILQNLIANAIKYTKVEDTILLKIAADEKNFTFEVTDHGYGIPKMQQSKIFTKLFRADNARMIEPEGTGLGLYIVKSIIVAAGGEIWFTSEENKGTSFFVSFPISGMTQKKGQKQLI